MRFRLRTLLIVLALGPIVLAAGCGVTTVPTRPPTRPFDAAAWRLADPSKDTDREIRGSMVDDLMAQKLLDGLKEAEVEQLLGPPLPRSQYASSGIEVERWQMAYHLGPTRDVPIDEEFLMIRLDEERRVVEYRVVPS
jgi:hypothetical protein